MSSPIPKRLFLYAQHLGNENYQFATYFTPTSYYYVLLPRAVPTDLVNADDYEQQTVTELVETLKIDRRFVMAYDPGQQFFMKGTAIAVCNVGAKGDGAVNTNISKIIFNIERVDDNNTYISIVEREIEINPPHSVSAAPWDLVSIEGLLRIDHSLRALFQSSSVSERAERIVLRVRVYAYMDPGGTAQAVRLYYTRGSDDTFLELPMMYVDI